ncbi:MAG: nuclear transport factor 2 family protein [Deltaproteobacteria bacterium]|nr:nuclear transport factor 2 family protein [Deltaproteobacteria bacterium]
MDRASDAADRLDVLDLVHRYFRCLDARDRAGLAACVTEDVEASHTLAGAQRGAEAFLNLALAELPGLVCFQHYCTNEEVTVEGDGARCRSYIYAQHSVRTDSGPALLAGGGRYVHECVRGAEGWRIARISVDVTWLAPGLEAVYGPPPAKP